MRARCLDDAAAILGNGRVEQFAAVRSQAGESAVLVGAHQAAVPCHVGRKNGREPALPLTCRHLPLPSRSISIPDADTLKRRAKVR